MGVLHLPAVHLAHLVLAGEHPSVEARVVPIPLPAAYAYDGWNEHILAALGQAGRGIRVELVAISDPRVFL
jgi:hypothetical protein